MICTRNHIPGFFLAFLVQGFFLATEADVPNESCHFDNPAQRDREHACFNEGHSLPGTLDLSSLDAQARWLVISQPNLDVHNVIHANYTPIPARAALFSVELWGFNKQAGAIPFPLNGFCRNNKQHIEILNLYWINLVALTAAEFSGFNKLRILNLWESALTSISPRTFAELAQVPTGGVLQNYRPSLHRLHIHGGGAGKLTSLDWSFLQPVASSLDVIRVEAQQDLHSANLTCSSPFTLAKGRYISFFYVGLESIPPCVLKTFNASVPNFKLELSGGDYCEGCGCCALSPLAKWLRDNNVPWAVRSIGSSSDYGCRNFLDKVKADAFARCAV